jgi:hypothetical protein
MNLIERLQRLDALIIEHTKPPVTPILRNQLALCTEEAEAHAERGDKQDHTLATQIETIERLMKENADLQNEAAQAKARDVNFLADEEEKTRKMLESKQLRYDV